MKRGFKTAVYALFFVLFALAGAVGLNNAVAGYCQAATAAEGVKTFIILPFNVNAPAEYKYLGQSISQMFASRLHWSGHVENSSTQEKISKTPPSGEADVVKAMSAAKANYAVWGTLTVLGEECSLDVTIMDSAGKKWPKSQQTKISQLIPSLSVVCDNIGSEVFGRASSGPVAVKQQAPAPGAQAAVSVLGGAGVVPGTGSGSSMNPSIQYSGGRTSDATRLRSQTLEYTASGMEVCDADGDGKNEVFIFDDYNLYVYSFENNRLRPLDNVRVSLVNTNIAIRSFDFSNSGKRHIILTSVDKEQKPLSRLYTFDGKKLTLALEQQPYFLNVIKDYETQKDILIGQPYDRYNMFRKNAVTVMLKNGDELIPDRNIPLPKNVNIYDFAYLPAGYAITNEARIVSISKLEQLKVFTLSGSLLSVSQDKYFGSPVGLDVNNMLPGMGDESDPMPSQYYVPIRMIPVDLNNDGDHEMIVSVGLSASAQVLQRYRIFLQSEVQCLYWDGVGMAQQWRTRTIQGGIVDVALNDLDNDGKLELIFCLNTGDGLKTRKTMVSAYKLNLEQAGVGDGEFVQGK